MGGIYHIRQYITGYNKILNKNNDFDNRTLFIWMVSLYLGWEQFSWIQVIGFGVLVTGTFYFNGVIRYPFASDEELERAETEHAPLLRDDRNSSSEYRD